MRWREDLRFRFFFEALHVPVDAKFEGGVLEVAGGLSSVPEFFLRLENRERERRRREFLPVQDETAQDHVGLDQRVRGGLVVSPGGCCEVHAY